MFFFSFELIPQKNILEIYPMDILLLVGCYEIEVKNTIIQIRTQIEYRNVDVQIQIFGEQGSRCRKLFLQKKKLCGHGYDYY